MSLAIFPIDETISFANQNYFFLNKKVEDLRFLGICHRFLYICHWVHSYRYPVLSIDPCAPNQLNCVLVVLVASVTFSERRLCFMQPSAHLVPFVLRIAESVGLFAPRTAYNLLAQQRVVYRGSTA
jgi:hypothetical protein